MVRIVRNPHAPRAGGRALLPCSTDQTGWFMVDVVINFFTSFTNRQKELVVSTPECARVRKSSAARVSGANLADSCG